MDLVPVLLPTHPSLSTFQCAKTGDYNTFSNLLFVSYAVNNYEQFVSSSNSATFPIVFNKNTNFAALQEFLLNFTTIDRIAFVTHGLSDDITTNPYIPFLSKQMFFVESDLSNPLSAGVTFMQTIVESLSVTHIDFLGCHLLLFPAWQTYFEILANFSTKPLIGASDHNVGNLQYGGDWILTSTSQNIEFIYFTSSIENYSDLLATYNYTYNDGTSRVYTYTSNGDILNISTLAGNVIIPSSLNSTNLTCLSMFNSAGSTNSLMTSLVVPAGITTIGYNPSYDEDSFYGASSLVSLSLPNTLVSIGGGAFESAHNLSTVNLPASLLTIGSVYTNNGAFSDCWALSSITIPAATTYIGSSSFANNQKTSMISSVTFLGSPQTIDNYAFFQTNLTQLSLPSVTTLGSFSFYGTLLKTVSLPASLITVGDSCFPTGLGSVYIPPNSNLQSIGASNPFGTTLSSIALPNSLTTIKTNCFQGCSNIQTLIIPSSVTYLGAQVFYNMANLQTVYIGAQANSLTNASYLLANCPNLTTVAFSTCVFQFPFNATTFVTSSQIKALTVTDPSSNNVFLFTGNYRNLYSSSVVRITNFAYLTLAYIIPVLPSLQNNDYSIVITVVGSASMAYSKFVLTTFMIQNALALQGNSLTATQIPGFTSLGNVTIYNATLSLSTNYVDTIPLSAIRNKYFYILLNSGDFVTLSTLVQPVLITYGSNYVVSYDGFSGTFATTQTFSLQGLKVLGGVFGLVSNAITNVNQYYHVFYIVAAATPTILTRNIYDNSGTLVLSNAISYGGQKIMDVWKMLDVQTPFTIGFVDETSNVTMDLAYSAFYKRSLDTTLQLLVIKYVNTHYLDPHAAATIYTVTVSTVFLINGTRDVVFNAGLYVFDQSDASNTGNLLVIGSSLDVISSVISTSNGVPGTINAYTTIDLPTNSTLYYFSSSTSGMGH